jgi:ribonucleoside-diphosphate reductase alpha chain
MTSAAINVVKRDGSIEPLQVEKIHKVSSWACEGLNVSQSELEMEAHVLFFDGIKTSDIHDAMINSAATLIQVDSPDYTFVAARLLLQKIYKEVTNSTEYSHISTYIMRGVSEKRLDPDLLTFDLNRINAAIVKDRDMQFTFLGLQTVADRYLIRATNKNGASEAPIIELPQHFFMRVAMGLALNETERESKAIEFYDVLSKMEFMSSTPTLFNSGTLRSQLSSCYLNTIEDSIDGIYGTMHECANLSKYAGGIGTDWTRVRPSGDVIVGTNGKSSGVIPYLKVFNDTAVAVNQGGKRNGAFAAYLEPWHPDLYDFIDLKKNTGDERRRAHDIFPAVWVPDLLFKRKESGGVWSFFSPAEFPELHELYGDEFEARYEELEREGKYTSQKPAIEVWKRIVTSLFETGHPWITMKDECNRRNPQDHVGVIHGSNLCTEITLNTSDDETAVCNLGSINLSIVDGLTDLKRVISTAIRMLDNVIDVNFYPSWKAKNSNMKHRPIGLGVMGYTEWLVKNGVDWESQKHLENADALFEAISYYAIEASVDLAIERGQYETFPGSKWSRGILPIDTARKIGRSLMNWNSLRIRVINHGVRNSNMMAIAPTATISNIVGTTPCIEPIFKRSYTKNNLSGTFVVVDPTLKYGRPELCKESFEVDPFWIIAAAAYRQKWIDQAQSVNIFARQGIKGSELSDIYTDAWKMGLKTTYYLRGQSAVIAAPKEVIAEVKEEPKVNFCSIDTPECESCQ